MNSTDHARLLVRVAGKLKGNENEDDRADLLKWADDLLATVARTEVVGAESLTNAVRPAILRLPLAVHKVFKHQRYEAKLLPGWRVNYAGVTFKSPSAAAIAITNTNQNGWRFWRYTDPLLGPDRSIEDLRHTTGVHLAEAIASNPRFVEGVRKGVAELNQGARERVAVRER